MRYAVVIEKAGENYSGYVPCQAALLPDQRCSRSSGSCAMPFGFMSPD
jgi:hypothetical protein